MFIDSLNVPRRKNSFNLNILLIKYTWNRLVQEKGILKIFSVDEIFD